MNDPKKKEKRQRELKLREAEMRREFDFEDADALVGDAERAHRRGDAPAAVRLAKKALALYPEHPGAMNGLGQVYFEAGQFADSAYYYGLLRKHEHNPKSKPGAFYNYGLANFQLRRREEARKAFVEFLEMTKPGDPRWERLRADAQRCLQEMSKAPAQAPAPVVRSAPPAAPKPEAQVAAGPKAELAGVLTEFLPIERPDFANRAALADHFLRRRFLELKLAQNFEDLICLGSLNGVDSYAYQHDTVRRVLRHFKGRALLADEVGLGKTIEACLILKEYRMRGMARRALVLTPPSLAPQWRGELIEKFGFAAASPDDAEFRRDPGRFWREEEMVVASIAMARMEPHASALAAAAWDMVIVDEAHCLKNRASSNWKLVNSLQKKFILMLTATPVENNLLELYSLITVLKPGLLSTEAEFKKAYVNSARPRAPKNPEQLRQLLSEVMVRNTRSTVDVHLPHRVAATVVAPPSPEEAKLYERVSHFVAARYKGTEQKRSAIALEWLQRQAGSSPQALNRAVARALSSETWLRPEDRRELESIGDLAVTIAHGAKGLQFEKMLAGRSGKMVVFTEFLPTLEYLAQICERSGAPYSLFSGDLSRPQKDAAIARFRDEVDVLLSTGSGGEGRNLQFANTVVNFDLPWNPMRIEQRVGRVHRIGQTQEVFVFNFCQGGSVEEQLLRVLHDKINMFELVVGEIDAILGELDESQDFAALVLDLWTSGREAKQVDKAFDDLAERLVQAKKKYSQTKELDESLFQRDFEA